jgi:ribosomal-protein-alanine N-acetyltransferase
VRADNATARRLYARTGWVDAGVRPRYYADGVDAVVMRWPV